MVVRRARRRYRVPSESVAPEARAGFEPTVIGYTAEQAMAEASRCLDCQTMCSLCVGVCPNMALFTYRTEPSSADAPTLRVAQRLQVAVLADLCNECGNCTTVCPTAGDPYRDKPRLYFDASDFEAESDNAFRLLADGSIEARWHGETHRLTDDGAVTYESPPLRARLDALTLEPLEVAPGPAVAADGSVSLEPAAEMLVLLRGLRRSMPHLPRAAG
jgi:putative selenate reductase